VVGRRGGNFDGVQDCGPQDPAGLHPVNARLGNGVDGLQRTLPTIRGIALDGPSEVKGKRSTWVQKGKTAHQIRHGAPFASDALIVALTKTYASIQQNGRTRWSFLHFPWKSQSFSRANLESDCSFGKVRRGFWIKASSRFSNGSIDATQLCITISLGSTGNGQSFLAPGKSSRTKNSHLAERLQRERAALPAR
jgi:hypothetical protein